MNESDLLARIAERSRGLGGPVEVGPGDDCAVVGAGGRLLLTVDQLVEGRHFDPGTAPDLIARKAVARSVSDIAAMAGAPLVSLGTGCLTRGRPDADELCARMAHWANAFGCPMVGGDLAFHDGPAVLTVTVLGTPHPTRGPVLRSGARAGDLVLVTGRLGGSYTSGRHLSFTPRAAEARQLADALGPRLHSMIDISDGLGRDAGRLAAASGVRIEINAARLPLHPGVTDWRRGAADGEDYELLFTAGGLAEGACSALASIGAPVSCIGRVVSGEGCVVIDPEGSAHDARELGWEHRGDQP
ncbi:MAG: thiamine-monophosphate kinase [Phycisphaerales bacterium]|nr:thiamine-monophosphate kinase [Phycisphaerales bacterium]